MALESLDSWQNKLLGITELEGHCCKRSAMLGCSVQLSAGLVGAVVAECVAYDVVAAVVAGEHAD